MSRAVLLCFLVGCSPLVVEYHEKVGETGLPDTETGDTDTTDTVVSGALSVSPSTWEFGLLFVGDSAEAQFTVENVGEGPLSLTTNLEASPPSAWAVSLQNAEPGPGESTVLTVTVTPADYGPFAATVTVSDAGSGGEVPLTLSADAQIDGDGDGVGSVQSGGLDCDDGNDQAYPGATEIWYDDVDEDCAGGDDFDQDGDGYALDADCDDVDAGVHPGAAETWYDGVDGDCDGKSDYDQDGDGYDLGADCDDADAGIHPGATETWYDGVDTDCDGGSDYDQDGDGTELADDCDDTDATMYPGAPETWYDGVDSDCAGDDDFDQDVDGVQVSTDCDDTDPGRGAPTTETWNGVDDDCDGTLDELSIADVRAGVLYGSTASYALGSSHSLALGGDLTGDGVDDLVALTSVPSAGAAWLVSGSDAVGAAGDIDDYDTGAFTGYASTYSSYYNYPLAYVQGPMGDMTGDATADLLVGATGSYYAYGLVLDGDDATGTVNLSSTNDATFTGDNGSGSDGLRWIVSGDVDGDGLDDIVTGCVSDGTHSAVYTGNVGVFLSSDFDGDYTLDSVADEIEGSAAYDYLGGSLAIGDTNGDGYDDIVAGASGVDTGASNAGAVYVFQGNVGASWSGDADASATTIITGSTASMSLGGDPIPTPGDFDGDGDGDVALAASASGKAWVFLGMSATTGTVAVTSADAAWAGSASAFGTALAASDLDGDGLDDLEIGASGDDTAGSNAGAVYVYSGGGPWGISMSIVDADASFFGVAAGDALGSGLAGGGDLDHDGADDLLVGASGVDTGASNGGAVYVVLGR